MNDLDLVNSKFQPGSAGMRLNFSSWLFSLAILSVVHSDVVLAQDNGVKTIRTPIDFASEILPIFRSHCFDCHGAELQQSNYRIDIKSRAFAGGDFGDSPVLAGNSAGSPLMEFITADPDDLRMPPAKAFDFISMR